MKKPKTPPNTPELLHLSPEGNEIEEAFFRLFKAAGDGCDFMGKINSEMDLLEAFDQAAKKAGNLVGRHVTHPAADGHAYYLIVADDGAKVTIQNVPAGDAWKISAWGDRCDISRDWALTNCLQRGALADMFPPRSQIQGKSRKMKWPRIVMTAMPAPKAKTNTARKKATAKPTAVASGIQAETAVEKAFFDQLKALQAGDPKKEPFGRSYMDMMNAEGDLVKRFDEEARKAGRLIGREVTHSYADSHARYLVVAEDVKYIRMRVIPIGDAWVLPAWGEHPIVKRGVVEQILRAHDGLKRIFASKPVSAGRSPR